MTDAAPGPLDGSSTGVAALGRFERVLQFCKDDARVFWLLMLANAAGIVGGYYYYWQSGQFDPSNRFFRAYRWWPFISDSPNAVVLMTTALLLHRYGRRRSRVLDNLAFTSMVYVGCWTTMLFLSYPRELETFRIGGTNNLLFISHMGMPLEALILVPSMRRDPLRPMMLAGIAAWHLLNLWLDYWGPHLHPAPFLHDPGPSPPFSSPFDHALHVRSPILMAVVLAAWVVLATAGLAKADARPPRGS